MMSITRLTCLPVLDLLDGKLSFPMKRFIRSQTGRRSWLEIKMTFRQGFLEESTFGVGARRSPPAPPTVQIIGPANFAITPSRPDS